jgi:hypothetical protein
MDIRNNEDGTVTLTEGDYINTTREPRTCGYCGRSELEEGVGEVSYHSGSLECRGCWNWRKLDGPAARHWAPILKSMLSNVDYHDAMTFFPHTLGMPTEEFGKFIETLWKLHLNCDHALALAENRFQDRLRAAKEKELAAADEG